MHSPPPSRRQPRRRTQWVRVSRHAPCPICHKPDWCGVGSDGAVACCMRVRSGRPMRNGGWLHELRGDLLGPPVRKESTRKVRRTLSADSVGNSWARWALTTTDAQVEALAQLLGLTVDSLRRVGACWAWPHEAWGFPMFDGQEEFTGIRLRSESGEKWALRGCRQGIFLPEGDAGDEALVVEGPTDAAAAASLGFLTIGRPSCTGGAREIRTYCQRKGIRRVSVIADNDGPGIRGAQELCRHLSLPSRSVAVPAKDLRQWVREGATRRAVEACLATQRWR